MYIIKEKIKCNNDEWMEEENEDSYSNDYYCPRGHEISSYDYENEECPTCEAIIEGFDNE